MPRVLTGCVRRSPADEPISRSFPALSWTESFGPRAGSHDLRNAQKGASDLQLFRAAYRNRTDDLRITRGMRPGCVPASCTDSTGNRTDGTRGAGIIPRPGPRTGP